MLEVPDKIRLKLAKKYLDWAEALPQFQGGTIAWLQEIRKRQREHSEYSCNKYKIPENISVEYSFFCLAELFFIEDVKKLKTSMLKLFPNLDSSIEEENFSNRIDNMAISMSSGSHFLLGNIVKKRKKNHYFFGRDLVEIESLPEEVSHIDVSLYKLFPSSFIIRLDVFLNDEANKNILELQKRPHLSDIRFEALIPIKVSAYSQHSSYMATVKEILLWKEELRGKVEKSLKPYINGYFTQTSSNKIAKLPSSEVILLEGTEDSTDDLSEWIQNNHDWLSCSGCNIEQFSSYTNKKCIFSFYSKTNSVSNRNTSNQLIILLDNYPEKDEDSDIYDPIKNIAIRESHSLLIALAPYCTYLQLIDSLQEKIEKLRKTVFTNLSSNLVSNFKLNSQIKLNNVILQNSILVDRVHSEINNDSLWFLNRYSSAEEFKRIIPTSEKSNFSKSNLKHDVINSTKERAEFLKNHIKLINGWYSQHLSLRNMSTTYWFTFAILLLTVVSVVGTNNIRNFILSFVNDFNADIIPPSR